MRPDDAGEPLRENVDDFRRVVDRQRRLRDVGKAGGIARHKRAGVGCRLDQADGILGQLAHGADHLGVPGVPDEHDFQSKGMVPFGLDMHFGHQRARGIEKEHLARAGRCRDSLRHPVCREYHRRVGIRDLVQLLHKNGAFGPKVVHYELVVDDLMSHVDGRTVFFESQLDNLDGAVDAGAEAAWGSKIDRERRPLACVGEGGDSWLRACGKR